MSRKALRADEVVITAEMRLGMRLKLARQIRGMTLKAVAEAASCSESLLSKIENGCSRRSTARKASSSAPVHGR